ncbi:MAG: hypothetical protein WC667_11755 [Sulfurimonas sp.]|jgi:hypothetical protein
MFVTEYAEFDGDSWEKFCDIALKQKYDEYQTVTAHTNGDYGIEGYIEKDGIVYQCYCPDENLSSSALYDAQRNKITTDLAKLVTSKKGLECLIKDSKIKQWVFLTPRVLNKKLNEHCNTKRDEIRKKCLSHLASDFRVLFQEIEYFINYLPHETILNVFKISGSKLKLNSSPVTHEDIQSWKDKDINLVQNIDRKINSLFPDDEKYKKRIEKLILQRIEYYLNGQKKETLLKRHEILYEQFINLQSTLTDEVEKICNMAVSETPQEVLGSIDSLLMGQLNSYLGDSVDGMELIKLKEYIISDWFAECPIEFD